jgi:membrane-bound lytic murein transglycosylase D
MTAPVSTQAMWIRLLFVGLFLAPGTSVLGVSPAEATVSTETFPRYPALAANVAFWTDVFTKHTSRHLVFHDPELLGIVWEVHDASHIIDGPGTHATKVRELRAYIDRETRVLAQRIRSLDPERPKGDAETRLASALRGHAGPRPSLAVMADRIRVQKGLGDRLCESYRRAAAYLPQMRPLMSKHGVPEELVYLPLVESGYNIGAFSHKGAVGIYQFTRATGRRYLRVDDVADERRDPLLATDAAARYLRSNYDRLGTWPLAITAYNHGENGIEYAVRKLDTRDLPTIIAKYESRSFGFASKNFYAEFLAAIDSMQVAGQRCSAEGIAPYERDSVRVDRGLSFRRLASAAGVDESTLTRLNPALTPEVTRGRRAVPSGYTVFLPPGRRSAFQAALASLPKEAAVAAVTTGSTHTVRSGETLSGIAAKHRTTVATLSRLNGIEDARRIRVGQRLKLPGTSQREPAVAAAVQAGDADSSSGSVRVRPGETMSHIARRHGVSVEALQRHNQVADAASIREGQVLEIPGQAAPRFTRHTVGKGQTLSDIAIMYRTSVGALQERNQIRDPAKLRAGQVLEVPAL